MSQIKIRSLYEMFRDGLLWDAHRFGGREIDLWRLIPKDNIGRLQTISLIRKMANRIVHQFPGGARITHGRLHLTEELVEFSHTHRELGSSEPEMIGAWSAMKGIMED